MKDNIITGETPVTKIYSNENRNTLLKNKIYCKTKAEYISDITNIPYQYIINRIKNWYLINNQYYYFKPMKDAHHFINEFIGEKISEYFDLDTAHYQVAELYDQYNNTKYGVISKNFCKPEYSYKSLADYIAESDELSFFSNNLSIIDNIKCICKSDEEYYKLRNKLKAMFIRNYYNVSSDGNSYNIMLKKDNKGIQLAELYDYEIAYLDYGRISYQLTDIGLFDISNEHIQKLLRSDDEFQMLLNKLMKADINNFIQQVESDQKIIIPQDQKQHYQKYENQVKKLVLDYELIK